MGTSGTNPLDWAELPEFTVDEPLDEVPSDDTSDERRAAANANALLDASFEAGSEGRYVYLDDVPSSLLERGGSGGTTEDGDGTGRGDETPTVLAIESFEQLPDEVSIDVERTRTAAEG